MDANTKCSASLDKEREALWYFGGLRIIKALGEQTHGTWTIVEYTEPVGTRTFSYAPSQEDAAFYLIEGEAIFSNGRTTVHATAGTFLFLPRNVSFRYEVSGDAPARILTWITPMGFAHRVTNMGTLARPSYSLPRTCLREKLQQLATLLRTTTRVI